MTESFEKISSLVKQFEENREDYHSKKYDESNTRTDFIKSHIFGLIGT